MRRLALLALIPWWIGIHPFNPTYTRYERGARLEGVPYFSFPSMIETSFAF